MGSPEPSFRDPQGECRTLTGISSVASNSFPRVRWFRTLETPEAHWAAELISDAEKSYWLNLEIAGVRRQLAYEATRLKFNEGGA